VDVFNLPNPSSCNIALLSNQPLTEMSTRNLPGGKGRQARRALNLTAVCEADCLEDGGASIPHTPMGLHGLLQVHLYIYIVLFTSTPFLSVAYILPLLDHITCNTVSVED
jgi:hypothetical protein